MSFFFFVSQISWISLNVTLYLRLQSSIVKTEEEMEDNSDTQSSMDESMPEDTFSTQENTVDSTVKTEQQGEEKNTYTSSDLISCGI